MIADFLSNPQFLALAFIVAITIWMMRIVKIVGENERFAWFKLGKFAGFLTPGLHIMSSYSKFVRLKVGDLGTVSGTEFVQFHGADVPVGSANTFTIGDTVRIISFDDEGPVLRLSAEVATRHCPNCGHSF